MLRPEKMSRVSVTGSKQVMEPVIEAVHELRLLHVTDYNDTWDGFDPGNPIEGADEASEKLVTVRALKNTLGVDDEHAGPTQLVTDEQLETELEEVRTDVNELDDRRSDLKDELREVEERIDAVEPFAMLGIDLDLLSGYESLVVGVGEGDAAAIESELADADDVDAYEVFSEGDAVAVFVHPTGDVLTADEDPTEGLTVNDLLVGARFQAYEVPEAEGSPEEYIEELRHRKQSLESELQTVESELENLRVDVAGFLLAAEEKLTIEVQKAEAPLSFATTENAFVAEGWIPTDEYDEFERTVATAADDRVDVEELERADYDRHGHAAAIDPVHEDHEDADEPVGSEVSAEATADEATAEADAEADTEEKETVADGGTVTMRDEEPPVIQDNPGYARPFEALVGVINRPQYSEFDPTVFLFLTFPAFFGFMIGDVGYGLLYLVLGYWLYSGFDSDMIRSLGGVGIWAGAFTFIFGFLYGEIFGFHLVAEYVWGGSAPIHKGLQPYHADWALGWLVVSLIAGMVHLAIGWILDFIENFQAHGFGEALGESGSWLMMLFGLWTWVFADVPPFGAAPGLLVSPEEGVFAGHPLPLGFTGFPEAAGLAGLAVFFVGLVLLVRADPVEGVEFLNVLVNVLSYTRIAAVLLAKAGMAFVVNLLVFGVYVTQEEHGQAWHFGTGGMPEVGHMHHGQEVVGIMFGGLFHSGVAGILGGIVILVVGHLLVLALGVTSAGLQGVRLEYVEFFGKFYEGGGRQYSPFGHERRHTAED